MLETGRTSTLVVESSAGRSLARPFRRACWAGHGRKSVRSAPTTATPAGLLPRTADVRAAELTGRACNKPDAGSKFLASPGQRTRTSFKRAGSHVPLQCVHVTILTTSSKDTGSSDGNPSSLPDLKSCDNDRMESQASQSCTYGGFIAGLCVDGLCVDTNVG